MINPSNFHSLIVRNSKGQLLKLLYDGSTGYLINPNTFTILNKPKDTFAPLYHEKPKIISIVLGVKCNLHCSYCIQTDLRNRVNLDFSPKNISKFLSKLNSLDLSFIEKIIFWGGEPLVYWKTLTILVEKLKCLCPNLKEFYLSTNGTLLTQDKLNFLNNNNFSIQLSDDIFNEDRGTDLTSIRKLVSEFKKQHPNLNIVIHTSFTKNSPDVLKTTKLIENFFGNNIKFRGIPISPPLDFKSWNCDLGEFDIKSALLLEESVYQSYIQSNNIEYIKTKLMHFNLGDIFNGYACRFAPQKEICIDVHGNIYACRGSFDSSNIIGNIDNYSFPINTNKFIKYKGRAFCKNCPFLSLCKGICSQLPDKKIKPYCAGHYAFQRGNLRAALKILFDLDLLKIVNVDFDKNFQHCFSYETLKDLWEKQKSKVIFINQSL